MTNNVLSYLKNLVSDLESGKINIELKTIPKYEEIIVHDTVTGEVHTYLGKPLEQYYTEELTISPTRGSIMGCDA